MSRRMQSKSCSRWLCAIECHHKGGNCWVSAGGRSRWLRYQRLECVALRRDVDGWVAEMAYLQGEEVIALAYGVMLRLVDMIADRKPSNAIDLRGVDALRLVRLSDRKVIAEARVSPSKSGRLRRAEWIVPA